MSNKINTDISTLEKLEEKGDSIFEATLNEITGSSTDSINYRKKDHEVAGYDGNSSIISKDFFNQGFVTKEKWDTIVSIPSMVIGQNQNFIFCDCVTDRDELIIENRRFPRILFKHIKNLGDGSLILIKLMFRAGSQRINIYNGKGLVDPNLFDSKEYLKDFEDDEFNKPFKL